MEALIKLVAQKTGISQSQAQTAVNTVMGFLKEKLPAPVFAQVEKALAGETVAASVATGLGGLFGKK